jgi:hypothetical protein
VRPLLPGAPYIFLFKFHLPQQTKTLLIKKIDSVPPLLISGEDSDVLKSLVLEHLIQVTLPSLCRATHGWRSYLRQSVRNFYADKAKQSKNKKEIPLSDLADSDELANLLYASGNKKKQLY